MTKKYPANLTQYLDGTYVHCDTCNLRRARLTMGVAMDIAHMHNIGDHTYTAAA